jgi:hypothetical protein
MRNTNSILDKLSSSLDDLINKVSDNDDKNKKEELKTEDNPYGFVDISTFTEDQYYLGVKLYPWQLLILKIFYMGTDGNRHLEIIQDDEKHCKNCVWFKNKLDRFKSPCLNCEKHNEDIRNKYFESELKLGRISTTALKTWKRDVIFRCNFIDEMTMLKQDLSDHQDVLNQILEKAGKELNELVLVLGRRSGKALAIDTPILTSNGWKTMETIQIGDFVFGPDGNTTEVIAVSEIMTDRTCYQINFSNGDSIVADEDHEWCVFGNEIITTKELNTSHYIESTDTVMCDMTHLMRNIKEIIIPFETDNKEKAYEIFSYLSCLGANPKITEKNGIFYIEPHNNSRIYIDSKEKLKKCVPVKCIQVSNDTNLYLAGLSVIPTHNSLLTSIIALYEAYRLLEMGDPQMIYNLLPQDPITILNVASAEDTAKESVFDKIKTLVLNSPYFKKRVNKAKMQSQSLRLYTPADLEKNKELEEINMPLLDGSICIKSGTSNANTQVGKTTAVIIMDEVAGMISDEDSKMSGQDLYKKLKPSIATFGKMGKIAIISNPLGRDGILWDLYNQGLETDTNPIVFQLPTDIANPSIDREFLEGERKKDPNTYFMQYQAEFFDGAKTPYIHPDLIDDAFDPRRAYKIYGDPRVKYFAHADPGINNDNYAFVILHLEDGNKKDGNGRWQKVVVVDHIKLWQPTKENKVIISEVDDYIIRMCGKFNIQSVSFDSWNSETSIQRMEGLGIPVVKTPFTTQHQMVIYETLLNLFQEGTIIIYEDGDPEHFSTEAKQQLKYLQKKHSRKSFRIEGASGQHDDIPDAIAGAAWMALNKLQYGKLPAIRTMLWTGDPATKMYMNFNQRRQGKDF